MLRTGANHGFAADPDLPNRDTLLDADAVAQRLSRILGGDRRLGITGCSLIRAKYRIGESLRVVYRLDIGGSGHLVAARAFRGEESLGAVRRAEPLAVASGPLRPVAHDPELGAVWWSFPNDRKLRGLGALLRPAPDVTAPLHGLSPWTVSQVVEYAPERSVTLRAVGTDGSASAYVKAYAPGSIDLPALARRYAFVSRALRRSPAAVGSPEPLWWSDTHQALLLQAMPGRPWNQLAPGSVVGALRRLGTAIATLHATWLPTDDEAGPLRMSRAFARFRRLDTSRILRSAQLIGRARPDAATAARRLADDLSSGSPRYAEPVLLHGDCHPKNALLAGGQVALIDLDQAGIGPPAADLGSLLARLELARLVEGTDTTDWAAAVLDGYADVRPPPPAQSLAWHTSAALLAEQAMRAVNRVRPETLDHLAELLALARTGLRRRVAS